MILNRDDVLFSLIIFLHKLITWVLYFPTAMVIKVIDNKSFISIYVFVYYLLQMYDIL